MNMGGIGWDWRRIEWADLLKNDIAKVYDALSTSLGY